jgi:DNA-binding protein H-NS
MEPKTINPANAWMKGLDLYISGSGLEWSGKGRKPEWLFSELTRGVPLEQFLNPTHKKFDKEKIRIHKNAEKVKHSFTDDQFEPDEEYEDNTVKPVKVKAKSKPKPKSKSVVIVVNVQFKDKVREVEFKQTKRKFTVTCDGLPKIVIERNYQFAPKKNRWEAYAPYGAPQDRLYLCTNSGEIIHARSAKRAYKKAVAAFWSFRVEFGSPLV